MKYARLTEVLGEGKVRCDLCERRCVIPEGKRGYCNTRVNEGSRLYSLSYGNIVACESRPIEIKPFFHYWPGSSALTYSSLGCNFPCPWCQNWHISKTYPSSSPSSFLSPSLLISRAIENGDHGVCASFGEPTLLHEYNLEVFMRATENGLYSCYVSNGYMSIEALHELVDAGLSGLNIDVKGSEEVYEKYLNADVRIVWRNVREALKLGVHVEIVHLIITGVNDRESELLSVIEQHLRYAGKDVPLHFTRYFPAYKFNSPPPPLQILENAYKVAKNAGINYPYLGNVSPHPWENTYCPKCGRLLIERENYSILRYEVEENNCCRYCGERIPIYNESNSK